MGSRFSSSSRFIKIDIQEQKQKFSMIEINNVETD